jgi:hypothetical protein
MAVMRRCLIVRTRSDGRCTILSDPAVLVRGWICSPGVDPDHGGVDVHGAAIEVEHPSDNARRAARADCGPCPDRIDANARSITATLNSPSRSDPRSQRRDCRIS